MKMKTMRILAAALAAACLGACGEREQPAASLPQPVVSSEAESVSQAPEAVSPPASGAPEQAASSAPQEEPLAWVRETYLDPLGWELNIGQTFDSPQQIGANWMFYFEDIAIYRQQQGLESPLDDYPDGCYPVEVVVSCLTQYFEVDRQTILAGVQADFRSRYDPVAGTITHEAGRGGVGNRIEVTGYTEEEGAATIQYRQLDYYTGEPSGSFQMEVRLLEDGSFRYRSIRETG